jgi:hypothetical protein
MLQEPHERVWIVVLVESGIPVMVEAFADRQGAERKQLTLRANMNLEDDETGIFQIEMPRSASRHAELDG